MRKSFNKILLFPALVLSITGCNSNKKEEKKNISYKPAVVSQEEANKIKNVYSDMVEDYSKTTNQNANKNEFTGLYPLKALADKEELDFNVNDIGPDGLIPFTNDFVKLKDLVTEDFANYCNQFNPLVVDGVTYNAKAAIYEETEQFALIIQYKNIYVFFSNFYFDSDLNKHFEKEDESYQFSFNSTMLVFSTNEGKVDFPIKIGSYSFIKDVATGGDEFVINNEAELEEADARNAYDSIKYPFRERFYSNEILALVNSKSRSLEDHEEFIELTEKEIYLSNKTGKFNIDGLNYHGEIIDINIDEKNITINNDYYNIFTYSPRLFLMDKMVLTLRVTELHFGFPIMKQKGAVSSRKDVCWYLSKTFIISESAEATETGIRYKLKKTIDYSKPAFEFDESYNAFDARKEDYTGAIDLGNVLIDTNNLNNQIAVTYAKANGQFEKMVDLPHIV